MIKVMHAPEPTPEDRLLEIIENPPKQGAAGATVPAGARGKGLAGWAASLRGFNPVSLWEKAGLRHVNLVMAAVCALTTVYCGWQFYRATTAFGEKFVAANSAGKVSEDIFSDRALKDINVQQALKLAKEHNIFTLDHQSTPLEGLLVGSGQETANLRLVGVLWSNTSPQVMVEDMIEQKTHLLSVGDKVAGLLVKTIEKDKILLTKDGHVWELR